MDRGLSMSLSTDEDRGVQGRVMVCPVILTKPCGGGLKGAGMSDTAVCQLCLSRANYHPDLLLWKPANYSKHTADPLWPP